MLSNSLEATDCSTKDFELVKKYIAEFELDDRQLQQKEFVTLRDESGLLGFGRVREYADFFRDVFFRSDDQRKIKRHWKNTKSCHDKKSTQIHLSCLHYSFLFRANGFSYLQRFSTGDSGQIKLLHR